MEATLPTRTIDPVRVESRVEFSKTCMPLAAAFLDLGGTLLTERPSRAEIYAAAGRARGLAVDAARMTQLMVGAHAGMPRELGGAFRYSDAWFRAFQRRLFVDELGLDPQSLGAISEELFARFEDPRTFALYPGARELLRSLRARGLRVGLLSNWSARLPRLLAALELDDCFDLVLGSAAERLEKPDPAFFRLALDRAGVDAREALHAGDRIDRDVEGALRAGLQALLVDHEGRLAGSTDLPCPVATSLFELRDRILERCG
jgi:putative hydrolase of the HAD superfamily